MREFEDQNPLKHLGHKPAIEIPIFEGKNRQENGEKFPEFSYRTPQKRYAIGYM